MIMRQFLRIGLLLSLGCSLPAVHAQSDIEQVTVETYYISDVNDATDTIGGGLAAGSITYRVFLDLCDSCALRAIYGDAGHPLDITSTAPIFNNLDRGKSFGHQISFNALDENTVALDSWISLGAACNQRLGARKVVDTDGSVIGGANNDGGSANGPGLLANTDAAAGIPITEQDGLVPVGQGSALPPNFIVQGLGPDSVLKDSTIATAFHSSNTRIACSTPGVKGPDASNELLIAQITTTGSLSFHLNVEIEKPDGTILRYVAKDTLLTQGETPNGFLTYPPQCGCTDPDYLEYDPTAGCDDGSCATAIVFGCLDPAACNYSTWANFNVPALCCYGPDSCNGLDISIVCPTYVIAEERDRPWAITVAPNPVNEVLWLRSNRTITGGTLIAILDRTGRVVQRTEQVHLLADAQEAIDVSALARGTYILTATNERGRVSSVLLKQ